MVFHWCRLPQFRQRCGWRTEGILRWICSDAAKSMQGRVLHDLSPGTMGDLKPELFAVLQKKETDINIDALLRDHVSDGGGTASGNHRASRYGTVSPLPAAGAELGPRTPERCRSSARRRGLCCGAPADCDRKPWRHGWRRSVSVLDPLQSHFFNTLQAGELLYERMKQVLQGRPRAGRADLLSPCPAAASFAGVIRIRRPRLTSLFRRSTGRSRHAPG